jgi:excisionase family DNA binding protein
MPDSETPLRDPLVSTHQSRDETDERLMTTPEAAAYLRGSKSYLDKLRVYGGGPKFLRFGKRKVLYRKSDLDRWASEHRFGSTSEYASDRISPQDESELPANTKQQLATKTLGYNSG